MLQIKLDFQQSQHLTWRWLGGVLLIAGVLLNVLLYLHNQKLSVETNDLLAQAERIEHPVKKVIIPVDDMQSVAEKNQLKEADAVIKQLNLPWSMLFNTLETTREPGIDLLEVMPNLEVGEVLIIGKTENLKSVFAYMERLKKNQVFSKIDLNSHEKTTQYGTQALKFTIVAKWSANNE